MLSLSATQAALAARPSTIPVVFAVLRTWTNKAAGTVQATYYWSSWEGHYPYDGADRFFQAQILRQGTSRILRQLGVVGGARFTLAVTNDRIGDRKTGTRTWADLKTKNLRGASIEVSRMLVSTPATAPKLAGPDHTCVYRGDLVSASESAGEITLVFAAPEPDRLLRRAFGPLVDPKDVGAVYAYPIGRFEKVPLLNLECGGQTTLAEAMTVGQLGNAIFSDASRFPSSGIFDAWVDGEEIRFSGRTGNVAAVSIRARSGTKASALQAGAAVVELRDLVLGVAGGAIKAVDDVWVATPGGLVRVGTNLFEFDSSDADGTTLTLPAAKLRTLFAKIRRSTTVTSQPAFEAT
jgi:hypothetical protein